MVFQKAIDRAEPAEEVKFRVNNLIDCITYSVFIYTTRGLFEKDKLIFTSQVAFQVSSGNYSNMHACVYCYVGHHSHTTHHTTPHIRVLHKCLQLDGIRSSCFRIEYPRMLLWTSLYFRSPSTSPFTAGLYLLAALSDGSSGQHLGNDSRKVTIKILISDRCVLHHHC